MIDAPDRKEPRFPADKENIAGQAIAKKVDELDADQRTLRSVVARVGVIFCLQRLA